MSNNKPDPIGDLIESAKKHPVETYAAYKILTPKEKQKEIEENLLAHVLIGGILIITVGCLVAPMFHGMLSKPLREKMFEKDASVEQIKKCQEDIKTLKIGLWMVAIIAWGIIIGINLIKAWNAPPYQDPY